MDSNINMHPSMGFLYAHEDEHLAGAAADPASVEHFQNQMSKPSIHDLVEDAARNPNDPSKALRVQIALGEASTMTSLYSKIGGNALSAIQALMNNAL